MRRGHSNIRAIECPIDRLAFLTRNKLATHIEDVHDRGLQPYPGRMTCSVCNGTMAKAKHIKHIGTHIYDTGTGLFRIYMFSEISKS